MAFNENTRVKLPAILHLCRLGYKYLSLRKVEIDNQTNIFKKIFLENITRINSTREDFDEPAAERLFSDVALCLDNEDLGEAFHKMLLSTSGPRLIDFKDFRNNALHVVTELTYKNGDDEFRPDITILVNGMPLAFIEVKKPNNREGILAERERIDIRFRNKKFRRFINISQILVFSNNMPYDDNDPEPIQGAYYSTTSYTQAHFNYFREEENPDLGRLLSPEDEDLENIVLKDNNLAAVKHSPEFLTNKDPNTPTNRILTSLFSQDRLKFLLKYGFAYVRSEVGLEKHIMRYPQIFATRAIEERIKSGGRKGVIWHTQGSGKTALAFFTTHYLTDYFSEKGIVPKFYFIVDRLDLMIQATGEFTSRHLKVNTVSSKEELLTHFRSQQAVHNLDGQREITVVNIQKFKEDSDILRVGDYNINLQRVYFLDEVHRSYNPQGSFLANLAQSDRNAIMIGLTGTPLIGQTGNTQALFGSYIHKYYYDSSIKDGYTLKLIREGIETKYRLRLEKALKEIEVLQGGIEKRQVYAHDRFVEPMLDYVVDDFVASRIRTNDHTIGGMVVCDSADQARELFKIFFNKYNPAQRTLEPIEPYKAVREPSEAYQAYVNRWQGLTVCLILYDVGSAEERKREIEEFKSGKTDLLFVYNMLLTGFDARRLKKLYIARQVRDHNLLQTLTRVNRPYKNFRYGFVVDFADIRKEFDATNKAYFDELQAELGDEIRQYSNLFLTKEEIEVGIKNIREKLFQYDVTNAEIFSQQISAIQDRKTVLEIKQILENARSIYNVIRLMGHEDLLEKLDFRKLNQLLNETSRHLELLNLKDSILNDIDNTNLINAALENVVFLFKKVSEEELVIADQLREMLRRTRQEFGGNFDTTDPVFTSLYDELKRIFKDRKLDEVTQEEMKANIGKLQQIFNKVAELNRKNALLRAKYQNDAKYARMHKRIIEQGKISKKDAEVFEALTDIKHQVDEKVFDNRNMLDNEGYFGQMISQLVATTFDRVVRGFDPEGVSFIKNILVKEYLMEYSGVQA